DLFELGRELDAQNGFRLVVEAMLQSPFFLYLWDVGESGVPNSSPVPVTGYEMATRLSYFLWNTMPDDELFSLADDESLTQDAVLSAEVDRMLTDPKAADSIPLFHLQWLKIHDMSQVEKDSSLFPQWNESLVRAMQTETATFTDYVIREGDGLLDTLLR